MNTRRVLEVDAIEKSFAHVKAVDRLAFDVGEGEIFALLGPNGAGKTTTVRMLMGIIRPDMGDIRYSISALGGAWPAASELGYLPEERGLYKDMPVLQTLVYMGTLRGMRRKQARLAALQWLERLALNDRAEEKLDALSKGNQQKIQFISAVLHGPRFLILDEPFSGLDPINQDETVMAPFQITTSYHEAGSGPSGRVEKVYAGAVVILMILAVLACYQYQFTSITGEKHLRVTEQIISAISPQVWMDGKILGISAIGLALVVVYGSFSLLISGFVWWLAGFDLTQLAPLANPPLTLLLLTLAVLGLLFWNCFFAAIAATVDDPNTSSRSVIMFLPFLPVMITLAGLRHPDSTMMKVLGIFPVTSPAALSVRLVVTEVAAWEVFVALALLVGTIWLLRKAAAKIFRLAMLMYGKEPSLAELGRWLYES